MQKRPGPLNFKVTDSERTAILLIVSRAAKLCGFRNDTARKLNLQMDITACHCNGCPLDLDKLLAANDTTFLHDIAGITVAINRSTGQLENCFVPRCASSAHSATNEQNTAPMHHAPLHDAYTVEMIGYGPLDGPRVISASSARDALNVARRFLGYADLPPDILKKTIEPGATPDSAAWQPRGSHGQAIIARRALTLTLKQIREDHAHD